MIMVTVKHMRQAKYCVKGTKQYFNDRGWNWKQFVKSGLPAELFEGVNDAMANKLAKIARNEAQKNG